MRTDAIVIMPVHNGEKFLGQAIESILNQTFKEFAFFIINDGSTDSSELIIKTYANADARIVYFSQEKAGLINTLNKYFGIAECRYLVRMDCDDIALPNRLEKQIGFLEENPEVGILGSSVISIDEHNVEKEEIRFPTTHNIICWKMLYTSGFCHPATVIRKEVFSALNGYAQEALYVEDYDFFIRSAKVTRLQNLEDILFLYRWHPTSVSATFRDIQKRNHLHYSRMQVEAYKLMSFSDDCLIFLKHSIVERKSTIPFIAKFLFALYAHFIRQHALTRNERIYIKNDVARKSIALMVIAFKENFFLGVSLFLRSFLFRPQILLWLLKMLLDRGKSVNGQ